jgi:hypothetical protein
VLNRRRRVLNRGRRVLNRRRRVLDRRRRVLDRGRRVLDRGRRVLDGGRRVLDRNLRRGVRCGLADHRGTRAAVAGRTAGTRALDTRAGVRGQPVATYRAAWASATLDGGFVPSASCRAMLGRDSGTVRDGSASS